MTVPLLEVEGLSKRFRAGGVERVAVDSFSCRLEPGESIGIVGESGAGKSTVAQCIVGLMSPTSGSIRIQGAEVASRVRPRDLRHRSKVVQLVSQHPRSAFDPRQIVSAAVAEVLDLHFRMDSVTRTRRVGELFDRVALPERSWHSYPSALSGGQLQRVAIARALAVQPAILVLDEYVSALDVSVQARILNLIDEIRADTGVATLVITHDLAVVRHAAERIVVMRAGAVVEEGPTAHVLDHPQHAYTRALRAAVPVPGWRLE